MLYRCPGHVCRALLPMAPPTTGEDSGGVRPRGEKDQVSRLPMGPTAPMKGDR